MFYCQGDAERRTLRKPNRAKARYAAEIPSKYIKERIEATTEAHLCSGNPERTSLGNHCMANTGVLYSTLT